MSIKRARRSTSSSRDEGVGGLHLTHTYNNPKKDPLLGHQAHQCSKAADLVPDAECTRKKNIESQENRSEQTYRPLGDRLGPPEPTQAAHKR